MKHPKGLQTRSVPARALLVLATVLVIVCTLLLPSRAQSVKAVRPLPLTGTRSPIVRSVTVSNTVVISQVYGGGGNSSAPFLNDYVELFNLSNTAVSLSGWSVQYASGTGTGNFSANPIAILSGSIAPGGYYLVKEGSGGGAVGVALPTPDTAGTVNMSGTAGKVVLVNTTTGLACNGSSTPCPASELAKIVDLVGYGSANFFEGVGAAPTLSNTSAGFRGNNGCAETDNNSADFATAAPNPRNTATAPNICGGSNHPSGIGAANPSALLQGNSTLLTVAVTPGTAPASTGITVTGNLSAIGGSATQQFFNNGTNGDVTAGDNIFSYQVTVSAGTIGGVKTLPISIADAELRTGSTNIFLTVQAPANPSVTGAANPSVVAQGGAVTLTATVSPGLVPSSTGIIVNGNLSSIGGSATQLFFDDGTNGDAAANNNVFTFQTVVPASTTTGTKSISLNVTDAQARSGSGAISLTVTTPPAPHDPSEHLVMGNPSGATADVNFPDNYLMMKLQYATSYNNSRRIPNWTSWHLDSTWRGSAARQDDFRNDATLPPGFNQVQGTDYSGSGFDRGHMCPSADRTSSIPDNSATFLMTNMVPQAPGNNQGPWAALENYLRAFLPDNEVYIVSGPAGIGGTGSGGGTTNVLATGVTVPATTWKVALILPLGDNDVARVDGNTRTIAVIMPNNDSIRSDQWQKYLATVDQVEALSGYDFFSNVPAATQAVVEAKLDVPNDTAPVTTGQTKATPVGHSVAVTLSATDFNVNNVFTYTIVTPPSQGSLSGGGAALTYSPNPHFIGPDSFTFKANDGALDSNVSTVNIDVQGPTSVPATISGSVTTANGSPLGGAVVMLSGPQSVTTITSSSGSYRFDNVATENFYKITPALANYHFVPGSLSFSLLTSKTDAVFLANSDAAVSANALDTPEFFVRQQYLDLLGREPDQRGLDYWSTQIRNCGDNAECLKTKRVDVSAAFFMEQEFQASGSYVYDVYAGALGRRPMFGEYSLDRQQVVGGANLDAAKSSFAQSFVQRVEFTSSYQKYITAESFIEALIQNARFANVDLSGERASLIAAYNSGATTDESRAAVVRTLADQAAFKQSQYNQAFVLTEYFAYLRRDAETDGYNFWVNVLNSGAVNNYRGMVCSFINSTEYQQRFSPIVTHSNRECGQ